MTTEEDIHILRKVFSRLILAHKLGILCEAFNSYKYTEEVWKDLMESMFYSNYSLVGSVIFFAIKRNYVDIIKKEEFEDIIRFYYPLLLKFCNNDIKEYLISIKNCK